METLQTQFDLAMPLHHFRVTASPRAPEPVRGGFRVLGCSHHTAPVGIREQLAFDPRQIRPALAALRQSFPGLEAVLLSTCNRVELYVAHAGGVPPGRTQVAHFLARFHALEPAMVLTYLDEHSGQDAVRHLFLVAASLDSMVLGEPQILAQVKQAYQQASDEGAAGPCIHALFQSALRVARRVSNETEIHHRRVSVPSVAVADFAQQVFDRFDDKQTLVIGAGEMAAETLKYLQDHGARRITIVNRSPQRAADLAATCDGDVLPWDRLAEALAAADLVISTTGAREPIVTRRKYAEIEKIRGGRPLFVLDLAVPRDFDPEVGRFSGVFLYSLDDLQRACAYNQRQRDRELPVALGIVDEESARFLRDLQGRDAGPVIQRLREDWGAVKQAELQRLLQKLPQLDDRARQEINGSMERLMNKLLHPPLETLREQSREGMAGGLVDSLARLFQLQD